MKKRRIMMIVCFLSVCLLCSCLAICCKTHAAQLAGAEETVYSEQGIFFSSSAPDGGDGSLENPYNDLAVISNLEIGPGTYLYLERGSLFYGNLVLSGISGSEASPVVVTAYGQGEKPKIDGNDLSGSGIVHIENCSHLIVEELELFDSATAEGDRRGVLITCDDPLETGEVITYENITLRNLYIHDICGYLDAENSGMAIWSKKTGGIHLWSNDGRGRIDGLTITGCQITDVSSVGIATWYRMRNTTVLKISPYEEAFQDYAHLNVRIADNEISNIGKNAIFARHLSGGVIEGNVIHDTAIKCVSGNTIVTSYVDGTVVQYNEGYRNMAQPRQSDGEWYDGCMLDADLASKDTIWQYNYSHDNAFGLFMNCTKSDESFHDTVTVRYNLSVNDHGKRGIIFINYAADAVYVYNNTIVTGYDTEYIIQSNRNRASFLYNNLIYNRSPKAQFRVDQSSGMQASNNLIYSEPGCRIAKMNFFKSINADGIYDTDPLFAGTLPEESIFGIENLAAFQLSSGSPALCTGRDMEADADFFGNDYVSSIGFYCSHDLTDLIARTDGTCTEDGMMAHYRCSACGAYLNEELEAVNAEALKITVDHDYKLIKARSATCTKHGNHKYYKCSICKQYFDADKNVTTKEAQRIPALGHTYDENGVCTVCGAEASDE